MNVDADQYIVELERDLCSSSLLDFMTLGWETLEPTTPFVPGWAVEAVADHLEAVSAGQITRLLVNVPPGCTKSMTTSVFWPMWEWGPGAAPGHRFISCSYAQELAIRDNVRARDLAVSEWYQARWGSDWQFKDDVNAKTRYENTATGWRQASSIGASLIGHRGDRIILDDPHAVRDVESTTIREDALRWFSETLPTRLNHLEQSAIVVIMQRVHERDISGLILAEDLGYEHLCLPMEYEPVTRCFTHVARTDREPERVARVQDESDPLPRYVTEDEAAEDSTLQGVELKYETLTCQDRRTVEGELLWPERFSAVAVAALKKVFRAWGGTYAEAGQLQQRPAPRKGGMFQKDDFQIIDALPLDVLWWVRGWDLASSDDASAAYTVGLLMGRCRSGAYVIADVARAQATPKGVVDMIAKCVKRDGPACEQDLPQDPGQAGKSQKTYLAGTALVGAKFHFSPESGSKVDRASPLSAQSESGNLYLLRGAWNSALISEYGMFPNGRFADQVDAGSRAFARLVSKSVPRVGGAPIVITG